MFQGAMLLLHSERSRAAQWLGRRSGNTDLKGWWLGLVGLLFGAPSLQEGETPNERKRKDIRGTQRNQWY